MAIIDTYNKSGLSEKIGSNAKQTGFAPNQQQGNDSEFDLSATALDKKNLNGSSTAPYTSKKAYQAVTPRK